MKKLLVSAAMLLCFIGASAQNNNATNESRKPFFTADKAPHIENILPDPPALTSTRFQDDWAQYQWGKSIRNTERGKLAVEDAAINATYFMKRFSPAMGRELTPETYPCLYRLLLRAHATEGLSGASAKKHFARIRPYQQFNEPTAVPAAENPKDFTSYPSGHTHASWLVGLIMTVIDPAHTEDIMKIAYEMGQSRVIVGFHYQSDIDAGRVAGSVTFARICSEPEFQEMMKQAIDEFNSKK